MSDDDWAVSAPFLIESRASGGRPPLNHRRVTTRYDKLASSFIGFVHLATIRIWITFVRETYGNLAKLFFSRIVNYWF
jgi:hypothetical protein